MPIPLVLASASPARLATLRAAGIEPTVMVADVDEERTLATAVDLFHEHHDAGLSPELALKDRPFVLANAKAKSVIARHNPDALVLACDSMLEFEGELFGKPVTPAEARNRWRRLRGNSAILHTGHLLVDNRAGARSRDPYSTHAGDTASTTVVFADLSESEIDAYVATGEPLAVAGGFTVDGIGGPFVVSIEGDYHNVVGLSLPLFRRLCLAVGVAIPELWTRL